MHLARLISPPTSLHSKIMLTLAVLVALAILCVAYFIIEHERSSRLTELENRAGRIVALASRSLAYPVWNVDLKAIKEQVDSLASDPEVIEFAVTAVGYGELFAVANSSEPLVDPIARAQDIFFTTPTSGSQKIGEVHVVLTRALIEQAAVEAHRTVLIFVVVILSLLYGATFVLLRLMVGGPVNRLGRVVDRIALGNLDARCAIESNDELGQLAGRVNTMAEKLLESDESLRDSETRLQLVLDGSQLGYWDWDITTGKVVRNAHWAEMLGYSLEEVDNSIKDWRELHHPDDQDEVRNVMADHLEGRSPIYEIEYRIRAKDESYRWIHDQGQIVSWDDDNRPARMCGTQKDITERKLEEREREKLQLQLNQAQKMESVGQLAGGVAHDFNNMLSVILGYTEIAMDQVDKSSSLFADLKEVHTAGLRSSDIVRQLLAFARQQTIAPQLLDLNTTVEGMLKMLQRLIGEDIFLSWLPGTDLGRVKIDPSQLDQLLANLCVNARDAIAGVGNVTVETKMAALDEEYCDEHEGLAPGEYALLSVSDDGCGIDKENLLEIFEPFFTTKKVGEGTGLGLATVYGIVKQNDALVNVYSEPGQGTTFNIYFPVYSSAIDERVTKSTVEINVGGTETILMVEDDPMVLRVGKTMLDKLGYRVLTAKRPQDAITMAEDNAGRIDLIMTDVVMPDMNGRDLVDRLLVLQPDIQVLFMSGYTADVIANRGILDEGVCFIHKPFSVRALSAKIREALESKASN